MSVFLLDFFDCQPCLALVKTGLLAKLPKPPTYIAPMSVMTRLLLVVLATTTSAFKTPKSRALKVRGGSTVMKVGTALIGLEGVVGMIAPEAACKNYGHTP